MSLAKTGQAGELLRAGLADVRASDDDGSSAADTGEPPADAPAGQSSESSPLGSGAATPLSAPALPAAANGGAPAGCPNPAAFPNPEGLLEHERGLGGAEAKRALSLQLGLGAYQRSQEDIAWVPDAGALHARSLYELHFLRSMIDAFSSLLSWVLGMHGGMRYGLSELHGDTRVCNQSVALLLARMLRTCSPDTLHHLTSIPIAWHAQPQEQGRRQRAAARTRRWAWR